MLPCMGLYMNWLNNNMLVYIVRDSYVTVFNIGSLVCIKLVKSTIIIYQQLNIISLTQSGYRYNNNWECLKFEKLKFYLTDYVYYNIYIN